MHSTAAAANLLFTTKEVAYLCEVPEQYVRNWASKGYIVPAVRGQKVKGHPNQFRVQQVLALVLACHYYRSARGCSNAFFREQIQRVCDWPWSAVEGLLGLRKDEWVDEVVAQTLRPSEDDPKLDPEWLTEEDKKEADKLGRRLLKLRLFVQATLIQQDRTNDRRLAAKEAAARIRARLTAEKQPEE